MLSSMACNKQQYIQVGGHNIPVGVIDEDKAFKTAEIYRQNYIDKEYKNLYEMMSPQFKEYMELSSFINVIKVTNDQFGKIDSMKYMSKKYGISRPDGSGKDFPTLEFLYETKTSKGALGLAEHTVVIKVIQIDNKLWISSYMTYPKAWRKKINS
jgi:hypothetical protein